MRLLETSELNALRQLTNDDLAQRWRGMEERPGMDQKITIANTGLVKSGKSSLFNALLDSFEAERFPTGAIRTTLREDREPLNDWVDIVDTPGIDATEEDDNEAFRALTQADIIVAMHNIKTGMLNRSESEWLKHLASCMSSGEIQRKVVFVCTWIDERDREEGYQSVIDKTRQMAFDALGTEVSFWEVSAKRYINALKKRQGGLAQASRVPQFRDFLLERAALVRSTVAGDRYKELAGLCDETKSLLRGARDKRSSDIRKKEERIRTRFQVEFTAWDSILKNFASLRQAVREKQRRLKDEEAW